MKKVQINVLLDIDLERCIEALSHKPEVVFQMLERAINAEFSTYYALMKSRFSQAPLIQKLMAMEFYVIGMAKTLRQQLFVQNRNNRREWLAVYLENSLT